MIVVNKLYKIIKEETIKYLRETNDDVDWDLYERYDENKRELFSDFLFNNNSEFTKNVPWKVIPYPRLKKIWEDFMFQGVVRDTRGLEMIEDIMTDNVTKISIFTELTGHSPVNPEDDFEDNIGYHVDEFLQDRTCNNNLCLYLNKFVDYHYDELPDDIRNVLYEHLKEKFFDYYCEDPKIGQAYISDYGLKPLLNYLEQLRKTTRPEDKVVIMDKMLNVVHMRSDMASWFVEGGSNALSQLSGSPSEVQ